jgi:hypothetical protein
MKHAFILALDGRGGRGTRPEWVTAQCLKNGATTHSVIALTRADSSPIKGEH